MTQGSNSNSDAAAQLAQPTATSADRAAAVTTPSPHGNKHDGSATTTSATGNSDSAATDKPVRPPPPSIQKAQQQQKQQSSQVLLNSFQIKKKRYRVLLHGNHLVWERFDARRGGDAGKLAASESGGAAESARGAVHSKETEYETEKLANKAIYGNSSNVVHINEIIRVDRTASAKSPPAATQAPPIFTIPPAGVAMSSSDQEQAAHNAFATTAAPPPTEQYLTVHYAERICKSRTDCNRWRVCQLQLYNADVYIVRQWHAQLMQLLALASRHRVQRLLVFINPYGGRKRALQRYERHCKPLFQLAGIDASCIISQRANQIRDFLLDNDLRAYDAVCCVGGDGTVAEVINGLLWRAMIDLKLDTVRPAYIPKPHLPIAIIPAGSTDTVAYSVHGTEDARTAAIHVVLGQRRGLDICSVRNGHGIVRFCASVMSYGYLGDVAAKSERYRWMGTKRYEYTGAKAFLLNRGYEAEIRLLPEQQEEDADGVVRAADETTCYADCQRCSVATETAAVAQRESIATHRIDNNTSNEAADFHELNCDSARLQCKLLNDDETSQPAAAELKDDAEGKLIKGKFFMISGANITCACSRSPNGISRYNHLGDGCLELILVHNTTLLNNLRLLLNTMGHSGDIRNLPFVEVHRTKRFAFRTLSSINGDDNSIRGSCQPIVDPTSAASVAASNNDDTISSWNCDGEVVTDLEIVMSSHCQLIDVFMRGPCEYSKPLKFKDDGTCFQSCCCNGDD